jgi:branched-subunit amino acid transport protein
LNKALKQSISREREENCEKMDIRKSSLTSLIPVYRTLKDSVLDALSVTALRRILIESMCYEGLFKTAKDFIQPIIVALVVSASIYPEMEQTRQVAILSGIVFFMLHLLSGIASAQAGRFRDNTGGDQAATTYLWRMELAVFLVIGIGMSTGSKWIVVLAFVGLAILQNLWRPLLISRCADQCHENRMATLLSIESQAKSIFTCIFAPLVGLGVDSLAKYTGEIRFLPVAILGISVSAVLMFSRKTIWKNQEK